MPLPQRRQHTGYISGPIIDPAKGIQSLGDKISIPLVRELLRRHSDLPTYGMARFPGTKAQKNALWREYRNYALQGLSYFDAANKVTDRSACLLLYYALLNFAKAELLVANPSQVVGQRIAHGLSFNPIRARKVASDALLVQDGVFRMLYEKRMGRVLPIRQRLPIRLLLRNIPEIGTQLHDVGFDPSAVRSLFHVINIDQTSTWPTLLAWNKIDDKSSTGKLFYKVFREVQLDRVTWREEFSLSRRTMGTPRIYESIDVAANPAPNLFVRPAALSITWRIKDIISPSINGGVDGWFTPSLYISKLLPMPSSLARYATIYYASSLVRYRPSIFDERSSPENSYLFDAIARECALPVLMDALSGLEDRTLIFQGDETFRA